MKTRIVLFAGSMILLISVGYCGYRAFTIHREKLGEISFYKDAYVELKVVLIHENIPLSYIGNAYSVACRSQNTRGPDVNDEAKWKFDRIEPGWTRTPQAYLGTGKGSNTDVLLKTLAEEARKLYLVKDKMTLVILASPDVHVSFDGCRSFRKWSLQDSFPASIVTASTSEVDNCLLENKRNKIVRDCLDGHLSGRGRPVFQDIVASDNGHAAFKATSPAFEDSKTVNVETNDFGRTWH
jgi:hypothetical protein